MNKQKQRFRSKCSVKRSRRRPSIRNKSRNPSRRRKVLRAGSTRLENDLAAARRANVLLRQRLRLTNEHNRRLSEGPDRRQQLMQYWHEKHDNLYRQMRYELADWDTKIARLQKKINGLERALTKCKHSLSFQVKQNTKLSEKLLKQLRLY